MQSPTPHSHQGPNQKNKGCRNIALIAGGIVIGSLILIGLYIEFLT